MYNISTRAVSLVLSVLLVAIVFADVLFKDASLSITDFFNASRQVQEQVSLFDERPGREMYHGMFDAGGALYQSEPAQQLMRYNIYHGESPYWNPYSGAGQLGPESLVDIKFSPFSLMVAIAGGSSLAFNLISLLLYAVAIYFLFRLLTVYFELSTLSALTAGIVYILNGFNVANLSSNISQSYLFFPACLYALVSFTYRPSATRYVGVVITCILLLANTFLPTTILFLGCTYFLASAYALSHCLAEANQGVPANSRSWLVSWLKMTSLQFSSILFAFLILAFLYFPIIESYSIIPEMADYSARIFYPTTAINFISFFTPKHFWESYNAMAPDAVQLVGNVAFHFGVIASLIVSCIFCRRQGKQQVLVIALALLFFGAMARAFGIPLISNVINHIPMLRNIGEQYIWAVVAFSFPLLCGFGFQSATSGQRASKIAILVVAASIFCSLFYTYSIYGFPATVASTAYIDTSTAKRYVAIVIFLCLSGVTLLMLISSRYALIQGYKKRFFQFALISLLFVEMFSYVNQCRSTRLSIFTELPDYVSFLKKNIAHDRLLNIGEYGVPPEYGAAFQIQELGSMNMNILPSYQKFFMRNFLSTQAERFGVFTSLIRKTDKPELSDIVLDMLSVRYIMLFKDWSQHIEYLQAHHYTKAFESSVFVIFENADRFPRVFAVPALIRHELTPDTEGLSPAQVAFTQDDQLLKEALLQGVPDKPSAIKAPIALDLISYRHDQVIAESDLAFPSIMILMDNWHPNWKAYLDGKEIYLGKVNESFRGVALPSGKHRIEMRYMPSTLPLAAVVSGGGLFLMGLMLVFKKRIDPCLKRLKASGNYH